MKRIVMCFCIMMSFISSIGAMGANDTIVLESKNTVVFRSEVDDEPISKAIFDLMSKDRALPKEQPLYLYLDTPGGSVTAGLQLIQAAKTMDREIKTITNFAASMGFIMAQSLGERLIRPFGTMMSHRAKIGLRGQLPGEANARLNFWSSLLKSLDTEIAERVGLTSEGLLRKHMYEWWMHGDSAVKQKAADRVVDVRCGASLSGTYQESIQTFFGPVQVVWGACPLISSPLKIEFSKIAFKDMSASQREEFNRVIKLYFFNKQSYLKEFIIDGRPNQIFKQ